MLVSSDAVMLASLEASSDPTSATETSALDLG